jgi:DNA-binding SARP family transcriptional activator
VEENTPASEIHVSLLGGFSVRVADQLVDHHWRLRKAKTLVKLLALAPGHWVHRDVVVHTLWPKLSRKQHQTTCISSSTTSDG